MKQEVREKRRSDGPEEGVTKKKHGREVLRRCREMLAKNRLQKERERVMKMLTKMIQEAEIKNKII